MRRQDTTSQEHQLGWRGAHHSGHGTWTYPSAEPGRRVRRGTIYLRCACGWRLVNIANTPAQRAQAGERHNEHVREMAGYRARTTNMRRAPTDV
jgi:hypothetical protein